MERIAHKLRSGGFLTDWGVQQIEVLLCVCRSQLICEYDLIFGEKTQNCQGCFFLSERCDHSSFLLFPFMSSKQLMRFPQLEGC